MIDYFEYGVLSSEEKIAHKESLALLSACRKHPDFEVEEIRQIIRNDISVDILVVTCYEGQIPTRNPFGIKNVERLALCYPQLHEYKYDVRALRRDFPEIMHQNWTPNGEPKSLCLYAEPWSELERTWTPRSHLNRIQSWLVRAASGSLHMDDQRLEPVFFRSNIKIILPPNYDTYSAQPDKRLAVQLVNDLSGQMIYRGVIIQLKDTNEPTAIELFIINTAPILHGSIKPMPSKMGELHRFLLDYGGLYEPLAKAIANATTSEGRKTGVDASVLVVMVIPLMRKIGEQPEKNMIRAIHINQDTVKIGELLGVLHQDDTKKQSIYYYTRPIGKERFEIDEIALENIPITQVDAFLPLDDILAKRMSGIMNSEAKFDGVIIGVGALGGCLADIWSKESWGRWKIIDDDIVLPHNIVRHVCKEPMVGLSKVYAVAKVMELNYGNGGYHCTGIYGRGNDFDNQVINEAITGANIVIDVSTTRSVLLDLANNDNVPRTISTFLTPSGNAAVLLVEDEARACRVDSLEAQYYRKVINSSWGVEEHNYGVDHFITGYSCREVSFVLSYEQVSLFSGLLSRQIRKKYQIKDASISVWINEPNSGSMQQVSISVQECISHRDSTWTVCWDKEIEAKMRDYREINLPNETGGIIVGMIDQKTKRLHIVDVLEMPSDSIAEKAGFERGIHGLKDRLDEINMITAGIVKYIGEWHSHPKYSSSRPSKRDYTVLSYLAANMAKEGAPALMSIVSDEDVAHFVQQGFDLDV